MKTLRKKLPILTAILMLALFGLHASSATTVAAGIRDGTTADMLKNGVRIEGPPSGYYTYALYFLAGYIIADLVDDFFGDELLPSDPTFREGSDRMFDF